MPGSRIDELVTQIRQALPETEDLDTAVKQVQRRLDTLLPGLSQELTAEISEAREIVDRQFGSIEILRHHSVFQSRPQWYFGPRPSDLHWPAVRAFFLSTKDWPDKNINRIDKASSEIVSLMENPAKSQFSCRGLVVGHVQSGKTANMTAVAAKALDAGYDTVIVLAGLTNKLRFQTQVRLSNDLVGRHPLHWQVHTPDEPDRDFRAPPHGGFLLHVDKAQLAVIKKNVSPLRELKIAVEQTLPAVRKKLKILVIDDECDQASINSARRELDMTAINHRIRELLSLLPAVTYVGYTATPFANVLIDPYLADSQEFDDLYPRDFITALPEADGYFGTETLFGTTSSDADEPSPEDDGLDMIRDVPTHEQALLQPASRKERDSFYPIMTNSLETAILYFLASSAARHARGDSEKHMTMLVHTSAYVIVHERIAALIRRWVEDNRSKIIDPESEIGQRVRDTWVAEQQRVPAGITNVPPVHIDLVFQHLPAVLDRIDFPIENGTSDDRIDYSENPKTYIVVGGSILARGLTLEGLIVSYFLRATNQYDTLLQMGRWFGYRPRYEDLARIWMTEELRLRFRALASIEQEIRDDIEQYRKQNLTPMDAAVRIRAIPGMAITGANRMRAARRCAVSYWGTHRQTFRFDHRDKRLLRDNWTAAAKLLNQAEALGLRDRVAERHGKRLWREVPRSPILRFFKSYSVHATHSELDRGMLIPFLKQDDKRLQHWNVGIVEAKRGLKSREPLGPTGTVRMVNRARLAYSNAFADIKALMSKRDVLFDCNAEADTEAGWDDLKIARSEEVGDAPLLLLYPVERASEPKRHSSVRVALDAAFDVLGYGIVFPGSVTEGGNFVSVKLKPLSADEIEEIAAEEAAQVEAAGVE